MGCGGGSSGGGQGGGNGNPSPSIASLSPSTTNVRGSSFTLTVNGTNLMSTSVVQWNGSNQTTTSVNSTQLTATIPANAIAVPGTAQVTVLNPAPGGGVSNAVVFTILSGAGVAGRVSIASDGTQANGQGFNPAVSVNGRFVAFGSAATNLVPGDTNGAIDIFLRDTCSGVSGCTPSTVRVSVASDGTQANGDSALSSISADGRFIVFSSTATNLVPGDTNGVPDIFLRDTCFGATNCTPSTVRVSVASDGTQGNGPSSDPAISADGRFIAFTSAATNLASGDTNGTSDIFLRDTCFGATNCTPSTVRVSVANDGTQGNGNSTDPAINGNGRFISFLSAASNLVPGDTNGFKDVFVRDTCFGATNCTPSTVRLSVASDGTQGNNDSSEPSISADGRFVAFGSSASNLVPDDTNGIIKIFVRDTCVGAVGCTPSTKRVSGGQADGNAFDPAISADGRFVAFGSDASNLVPGDTSNGFRQVYIRDTCFGATSCTPAIIRVSVGSDGVTQGNAATGGDIAISADGRFVVFASAANNLVAGDTNGVADIFITRTGF